MSLAGTLTPKVWTDRDGQPRPTLDLIASQVLTVYQVKRKRESARVAEPAPLAAAPTPARRSNARAPSLPVAEREAYGWPASDHPWT